MACFWPHLHLDFPTPYHENVPDWLWQAAGHYYDVDDGLSPGAVQGLLLELLLFEHVVVVVLLLLFLAEQEGLKEYVSRVGS